MPVKTFKCEICGSEVSRPQSYAYNNGRACRNHEEVNQYHEQAEAVRQARISQETKGTLYLQQLEKERQQNELYRWRKWEKALIGHRGCWVCGLTDGLSVKDAMLEFIANKHMNPDIIIGIFMGKPYIKNEERTKLIIVPVIPRNIQLVDCVVEEISKVTGYIRACGECRQKYNLEPDPKFKEEINKMVEKVRERLVSETRNDPEELSIINFLMKPLIEVVATEHVVSSGS